MRTNLMKLELLSEKVDELMKSFHNGTIINAEVIDELIKLAENAQSTGQRQ